VVRMRSQDEFGLDPPRLCSGQKPLERGARIDEKAAPTFLIRHQVSVGEVLRMHAPLDEHGSTVPRPWAEMSGRTVPVVTGGEPPGLVDGLQEIDAVPEQPGLPRHRGSTTCPHHSPGSIHQVTCDAPHDDP